MAQLSLIGAALLVIGIVFHLLRQILLKDPKQPPLVFHWLPFLGSTIAYGTDPYKFFFACRAKYGDTFTFVLLGRKTTVCLGTKGNDFVLNGKLKDVNAEEIYSPLTTPVFGPDVVYDCPNSKLMEQKKFVKFGLTTDALRSYVRLITQEVESYLATNPQMRGQSGTFEVLPTMEEITIFTASRSLQGPEVRSRFDAGFARFYHALDMGFSPINFLLPWAPLPHNRARDHAHNKMTDVYMDIILSRKEGRGEKESDDMIKHLMACTYKNGTPVPDIEIAHMMIALLMAGQHSSASTSAWIMLNLASKPEFWDELYQEQVDVLGADLPEVTYDDLPKLKLHAQIVKETLRIHAPIHTIMRKVKNPVTLHAPEAPHGSYVIPTSHVLLSAPGCTGRMSEYFPEPLRWEPHRWDPEGHPLAPIVAAEGGEEEKVDYGYGLMSKGTNSPYLPFGAGRHRCIGEQFAYVQLGVILAVFVRKLRLRNIDGSREVVPTDYSSLFSRPRAPTIVAWEAREKGRGSGIPPGIAR